MFKRLLILLALTTGSALSMPVLANDEFPVPAGFTSEFKTIDGVKIHYVKGGSGPLVYLVHGFGQTWYEWHQLMPELARTHTVVAPDLPGLGQSDAPPSYRATEVSKLIYALARNFSGGQKFDLVAHDIGIWNTYPMLVANQDSIRRVVYMEAPIPDKSIYDFKAFMPTGESLVWHFSFFAADNRLAEALIAGKERTFFEHFIKEHATNKAAFTPSLLEMYARSYSKPSSLNAAFEYYRVLNQGVVDNKAISATKISVPALAIGGGGHGGMGNYQVEQMKRYATDVSGLVIPECGHWLPEECSVPLNNAVRSFLVH